MQSCCKGVDRGSEVVLAVFPSAQFPGRQVWKMKRVCLPRRPRGQTGEKMTTRHQCQSSLSVLTLQIPQVIGKYLLLIITNTLSNRQVVGKGKFISQITLYRGYYTVAPRYEFYFRVAKTIFYSLAHEFYFRVAKRAQRVSNTLFLPRENKIHIFKPPCSVLFIM